MIMNLDIQNIVVLKKMYQLKNVGLVAEAMGKTSGAISKTLSKLKSQLDDPLFVQTKSGFEPTSFMDANIHHFDAILRNADAIQHQQFSPSTLSEHITIYANTLFWSRFGDRLYLALQAPHAKFSFLRWGEEPKRQLLEGENCIAIHALDDSMPQSLYQRTITTDRAVFFVRNDHPAQTLEQLIAYPMVVLQTPGWNDHKYRMLDRLKHIGYHISPAVEVENPVMSHNIVLQSDHFGLTFMHNVPKGCRVVDTRHLEGLEVTYVMSCRRAKRDSPLNSWLFSTITSLLKHSEN
ncbi:LysR family transcriptional regulator [Vibrio paucivorans]